MSNTTEALGKFFERLTARLAGKQRQGEQTFRQLAAEIADNTRSVKEDQIEQVLAANGKTIQDLQSAVELVLKRRELAGRLKAGEVVPAKRAELAKTKADAEARFLAAQEKFRQEVAPLGPRVQELNALERAADQARGVLFETAPRELHEEMERLRAELRKIAERRSVLGGQLKELRAQAEVETVGYFSRQPERVSLVREYPSPAAPMQPYAEQTGPEAIRAAEAAVEKLVDERRKPIDLQLAELAETEARLQREAEALEAKMLVP